MRKEATSPDYYIEESLRQNLFWLQILKEHALFLKLGLPCDRQDLRNTAEKLEKDFDMLLKEAKQISKAPTEDKIYGLNRDAINATTSIINYKSHILKLVICCNITTGFNFPLLLDHVRREAIYFRASLVHLQKRIVVEPVEKLLKDEVFWLRTMADHSRFISHLLDPSERKFINKAQDFMTRFDDLRFHAEDFGSMLNPQNFEDSLLDNSLSIEKPEDLKKTLPAPYSIGSLDRFTNEAINTTEELKDFKRAASELINNCRILGIIPPLLADHVLREAMRAIEDLSILQKKLIPMCKS